MNQAVITVPGCHRRRGRNHFLSLRVAEYWWELNAQAQAETIEDRLDRGLFRATEEDSSRHRPFRSE